MKIPTLTAGGKTIYLYYGNDSATNSEETWTGKFILLKDSSCDPGWTTESESDRNFLRDFHLAHPRTVLLAEVQDILTKTLPYKQTAQQYLRM